MRAALLALVLAGAASAAPATQAPAPGWTLEKVRAELARIEKLPAPAPGVLVLPLSSAGAVTPDGGAVALLAMLIATNVPRQVLAPDATQYLIAMPRFGYHVPGRFSPRSVKELQDDLQLPTVARAEVSDPGPEPELTLSFEGPKGAKVYKQKAKLAALVPWIALRIHEYLGTELTPDERKSLEATAIPEAELARVGAALHLRNQFDYSKTIKAAAALDAEFPARPECWLANVRTDNESPEVLAASKNRFPGHPYVLLAELNAAVEAEDWNAVMKLGLARLAQDWRDPRTVKWLFRAAEKIPVAGAGDAILQSWSRREPGSAQPFVAESQAALETAWDLRGHEFSNKVDQAVWPRVHENVKRAVAAAERAHGLAPRELAPVIAMLSAQLLAGDRAVMKDWFERGRAIDPAKLELYNQRVQHLHARWYGSEPELLAFCQEVIAKAPPEGGAQLAILNAYENMCDDFKRSRGGMADWVCFNQPPTWAALRVAFEKVLASQVPFPLERQAANYYARNAYWMGDRAIVKRMLPIIGENWLYRAFPDYDAPAKLRAWSAQEQPKPAEGGKAEYKLIQLIGQRKVPTVPGVQFGIFYEVIATGAPVQLRIELHHPPMKMPGGEVVTIEPPHVFPVKPGQPHRNQLSWSFQRGYEYEFVPGTWTYKVLVNDREIAAESFEIVR